MRGEQFGYFFPQFGEFFQGFLVIACFASRISHTSGELPQVSRWGLWRGAMEDPPEVWGFWMDGSVFGETLRFVGHTAYLKKGIYSSYLDPCQLQFTLIYKWWKRRFSWVQTFIFVYNSWNASSRLPGADYCRRPVWKECIRMLLPGNVPRIVN